MDIELCLISFAHILCPLAITFWVVFGMPSNLGQYSFAMLILITIHWVFLNGECIASLFYKWRKNPAYQAGDTLRAHDLYDLIVLAREKTCLPHTFLSRIIRYGISLCTVLLVSNILIWQPASVWHLVDYLSLRGIYNLLILYTGHGTDHVKTDFEYDIWVFYSAGFAVYLAIMLGEVLCAT